MPGIDGLETARLIKGRDRSSDVPIVFLTAARDEVEDIIRGYGVGAVDYVLKPFDPELLRSKVAVFAELESGRRALQRSEALLRGAFEAAPIGKTLLDSDGPDHPHEHRVRTARRPHPADPRGDGGRGPLRRRGRRRAVVAAHRAEQLGHGPRGPSPTSSTSGSSRPPAPRCGSARSLR